ncbi:hypothetical protein COLO4_16659 [Corchorus olitorius]|uniref:Uncharacterized protein n=1 Tax=Corchorus olitorius TaxID=93759 RepID=A0A1R3JG66_9ROSI|nr:hypothetical protein COLO4_16659 [Corchorus olitorius]
MDVRVKQEIMETSSARRRKRNGVVERQRPASVIELSSSSSDSDSSDGSDDPDENDYASSAVAVGEVPQVRASKKRKMNGADFVLPLGFLNPLPPDDSLPVPLACDMGAAEVFPPGGLSEQPASKSLSSGVLCKQFWKAGDYDGIPSTDWDLSSGITIIITNSELLYLHGLVLWCVSLGTE